MGQLGNLTHSAVLSPDGTLQYQASPGQAGMSLAKQAAKTAQPSTADVGDNGPSFDNPQSAQPKIVKPSFLQAANSGPGGTPNAEGPGLTKAGKLATILTAGLKGALAGRAASEQAVLQSGGHRSGGVGLGFMSGYSQPFQEAQQRQQAQIGQAELQPIPLPGGVTVPAAIAPKFLSPYLGYQGKIQAQQMRGQTAEDVQRQKSATAESVQGQKSETAENVARINQGMAIPVDETSAQLAGFPELAGQPAGRATWTNINKALEARGYRVQDMGMNGEGPNSGMWLMDRAGNRIKQVSPNSLTFQRGASFAQNRPEVVVDPNDPGYAYYTSAANAMKNNLPSPQGAGTIAAKGVARSEVPTKAGDQKVAFNTAIQHADLLTQALTALNDPNNPSNVRALNSLRNKFRMEFGSPDVTNFQAIANAYTREITAVLAKGHMTDAEIQSAGGTLPANASPQQILGAIRAYKQLAQSKMNMLNQQEQAASAPKRQGQPTTGGQSGRRVIDLTQ